MHANEDSTSERPMPRDIKLQRDQGRLTVVWQDGGESIYELGMLRMRCPCAACNAERNRKTASTELFPILTKDPGAGPPRANGAQIIGNYALQIVWADGHSSGIYDFQYLRELDEEQKRKARPSE